MKCLNVSSALKAFPLSTDGFQYWERNMFYCFLPKTARDSGINSHLSNLAIYQTYFSQYIWNIRKYTDWSLLSFDHLSLLKKLVFIFSCLIADRKIELPSAWLKLEEMKSLDVTLFFFLSFFLSFFFFFCYMCFLPQAFTIHRIAVEGEGYLFNSSLPCPSTSQTLRY